MKFISRWRRNETKVSREGLRSLILKFVPCLWAQQIVAVIDIHEEE